MQEHNNLTQPDLLRSLAQEIFEVEHKIIKIKDDSVPSSTRPSIYSKPNNIKG